MAPIKIKKKLNKNPYLKRKKRGVGMLLDEFLSALREFAGITEKSAEELTILTKSVDTGSEIVDDILKGLNFEKSTLGYLTVGEDLPLNALEKIIKQADLNELIKATKSEISVTKSDAEAFKNLVGNTPERTIYELKAEIEATKKAYPQFDVNAEEINKLPKNIQIQIKNIEKSLLRKFAEGTLITTIFGGVYVTADWIIKETRKRQGCFMVTKVNDKVTSCKIASHSCDAVPGYECANDKKIYNTTLMAMTVVNYDNLNETKIKFANKLNTPVEKLYDNLPYLLSSQFPKIEEFTKNIKSIIVDICNISHPGIENGKIPFCRACSSSASPQSTTFIDSSLFGKNITFECVQNPSILNVITEVMKETGINLLDGINEIGKVLKYSVIGVILAFLTFVLYYIWILFTKISKKKEETINIPSSKFMT